MQRIERAITKRHILAARRIEGATLTQFTSVFSEEAPRYSPQQSILEYAKSFRPIMTQVLPERADYYSYLIDTFALASEIAIAANHHIHNPQLFSAQRQQANGPKPTVKLTFDTANEAKSLYLSTIGQMQQEAIRQAERSKTKLVERGLGLIPNIFGPLKNSIRRGREADWNRQDQAFGNTGFTISQASELEGYFSLLMQQLMHKDLSKPTSVDNYDGISNIMYSLLDTAGLSQVTKAIDEAISQKYQLPPIERRNMIEEV
jgi:hypothetical protein